MKNIIALLSLLLLTSCASGGFASHSKINLIRPGMSVDDVTYIMGQPSTAEMINGKYVVGYELHKIWQGNIPYDFSFDSETMELEDWKVDHREIEQNRENMRGLSSYIGDYNKQTQEKEKWNRATPVYPHDEHAE